MLIGAKSVGVSPDDLLPLLYLLSSSPLLIEGARYVPATAGVKVGPQCPSSERAVYNETFSVRRLRLMRGGATRLQLKLSGLTVRSE